MGCYIDLNRSEGLYRVKQGQGYLHFKVHCGINNRSKYNERKLCKEKEVKSCSIL